VEQYDKFGDEQAGLPIGLLSSTILANYHLKNFDEQVLKLLSPVYYGWYVDDITIVKRVHETPSSEEEIENLIEEIIGALFEDKDSSDKKLIGGKGLAVQEDKIIKYFFDSSGPTTLLDKFEKELKQNSSEFRFLPEIEDRNNDFLNSAYAINFSGSRQQLRNVQELSPDKFGVSTFLAKRIFSALSLEDTVSPKVGKEIIAFFKYTRAIEFFSLWEKAYTYFVVTSDIDGLIELEENILAAIDNTCLKEGELIGYNLQETLKKISEASIGMALSLNPNIYEKHRNISVKFLKSNMTRHKYVSLPILSYLGHKDGTKYSNLTVANYFQIDLPEGISIEKILRPNIFKFCPRYTPFHEVTIFYINFNLLFYGTLPPQYLDDSFKLFYKLNYFQHDPDKAHYERLKKHYFQISNIDGTSVSQIDIPSIEALNTVNIGIGNIEISNNDIYQSLINKPTTSEYRKNRLFSIINQATREDVVDFLVLPEASVPCRWLNLLSEKSRKERMAFVFGLEHLVANGRAFNLIANLIPVVIRDSDSDSSYVAVIPILRIKNYYSPSEIEEIEGHHHSVPVLEHSIYQLVTWKNVYFTTFNCFELTNILDRSLFRSQIDILFACEYNSDINYFSNLVESSARDLHCYIVQANSSFYGDSRITQPTKTEVKDILKIKGGRNASVLIGKVDIKKLRKFQYLRWNLQLKDRSYKVTPPGFDRDLVAKRMSIFVKTKKE